ncbi:MAG: hypothetical protein A2020_06585 [Lentisphaerae bacterium GWF2_45_14]|nr:MAG: hypothetical protein A2020_06585 [Lentisphaerae bacterium GWF2_45_14]
MTQNLHRSPSEKNVSLDTALLWREKLRKNNKKLVVTNGCFDILHRGHVEYLCKAAELADFLLVLVNADSSVRRLKGPSRPLNSEEDRAFVLAALESVDMTVIFNDERCTKMIKALCPDVYVKGGDYTIDTINIEEKEALFAVNAQIKFISFVPGFSTTGTINKMNIKES